MGGGAEKETMRQRVARQRERVRAPNNLSSERSLVHVTKLPAVVSLLVSIAFG